MELLRSLDQASISLAKATAQWAADVSQGSGGTASMQTAAQETLRNFRGRQLSDALSATISGRPWHLCVKVQLPGDVQWASLVAPAQYRDHIEYHLGSKLPRAAHLVFPNGRAPFSFHLSEDDVPTSPHLGVLGAYDDCNLGEEGPLVYMRVASLLTLSTEDLPSARSLDLETMIPLHPWRSWSPYADFKLAHTGAPGQLAKLDPKAFVRVETSESNVID